MSPIRRLKKQPTRFWRLLTNAGRVKKNPGDNRRGYLSYDGVCHDIITNAVSGPGVPVLIDADIAGKHPDFVFPVEISLVGVDRHSGAAEADAAVHFGLVFGPVYVNAVAGEGDISLNNFHPSGAPDLQRAHAYPGHAGGYNPIAYLNIHIAF